MIIVAICVGFYAGLNTFAFMSAEVSIHKPIIVIITLLIITTNI